MTNDEKNSELYDEASDAIDMLFGDTGVDKEHTKSNLRELISELQTKLAALS